MPDDLFADSDRASAVVCGAFIEESLEALVRQRLVAGADTVLFDGRYAPLGTFAAKIDMAMALGLVSESEAEDMHRIRKIRNEFSHSLDSLSYDASPARDHIRSMRHKGSAITGKPCKARSDFEAGVLLLTGYLRTRLKATQHLPPCEEQHPQHRKR